MPWLHRNTGAVWFDQSFSSGCVTSGTRCGRRSRRTWRSCGAFTTTSSGTRGSVQRAQVTRTALTGRVPDLRHCGACHVKQNLLSCTEARGATHTHTHTHTHTSGTHIQTSTHKLTHACLYPSPGAVARHNHRHTYTYRCARTHTRTHARTLEGTHLTPFPSCRRGSTARLQTFTHTYTYAHTHARSHIHPHTSPSSRAGAVGRHHTQAGTRTHARTHTPPLSSHAGAVGRHNNRHTHTHTAAPHHLPSISRRRGGTARARSACWTGCCCCSATRRAPPPAPRPSSPTRCSAASSSTSSRRVCVTRVKTLKPRVYRCLQTIDIPTSPKQKFYMV